jgi:hypothetical protein
MGCVLAPKHEPMHHEHNSKHGRERGRLPGSLSRLPPAESGLPTPIADARIGRSARALVETAAAQRTGSLWRATRSQLAAHSDETHEPPWFCTARSPRVAVGLPARQGVTDNARPSSPRESPDTLCDPGRRPSVSAWPGCLRSRRRSCAQRLRAPASSAGEHGMSSVPTTSPRSPRLPVASFLQNFATSPTWYSYLCFASPALRR